MSVDLWADIQGNYRLLELSPELEKGLDQGLELKAPSETSGLYICTDTKSFRLRQRNQSNSLLLVRPEGDRVMAFGGAHSYLETTAVDPQVHVHDLPRFSGKAGHIRPECVRLSLAQLQDRSPASAAEFEQLWRSSGGLELDGVCYILDDDYILGILQQVILVVVARGMSQAVDSAKVVAELDEDARAIDSVLAMFSLPDRTLDHSKICRWLGIQVLRKAQETALDRFLTRWREAVPVPVDWAFSLDQITGHWVQPRPGIIRYLSVSELSTNPKIRFQQLLEIKSSWRLDEIVPFVDDLRSDTTKIESFVMKYAKRKRVGKEYVVTR